MASLNESWSDFFRRLKSAISASRQQGKCLHTNQHWDPTTSCRHLLWQTEQQVCHSLHVLHRCVVLSTNDMLGLLAHLSITRTLRWYDWNRVEQSRAEKVLAEMWHNWRGFLWTWSYSLTKFVTRIITWIMILPSKHWLTISQHSHKWTWAICFFAVLKSCKSCCTGCRLLEKQLQAPSSLSWH